MGREVRRENREGGKEGEKQGVIDRQGRDLLVQELEHNGTETRDATKPPATPYPSSLACWQADERAF